MFAGRFYPSDPAECRAAAEEYCGKIERNRSSEKKWIGGLVPHAGWVCSAAIAGQTIATMAGSSSSPDVVVVFGAVHTAVPLHRAALDDYRMWNTPGETTAVSAETREKLAESRSLFAVDDRFHEMEHAVEVELPLIRVAWPNAAVLPVEVPVENGAVEIGREVARQMQLANLNAVYLASSDLTHYGPAYRFTPAGVGPSAFEWAKANDRRVLDLMARGAVEAIVPEVRSRRNACGGGAIAAMLSACREFGAGKGELLRHANSVETLGSLLEGPTHDAVGYASMVVGQ